MQNLKYNGICAYEGHDINGVVLTFYCLRKGDNSKAKEIIKEIRRTRDLSAYRILSLSESLSFLKAIGYAGNINKITIDDQNERDFLNKGDSHEQIKSNSRR